MKDSLGLEVGVVRLVEYDDGWPTLFEDESRRILESCGGLLLWLEHIGSTAIPGVCAKPVLDILAGRPGDTSAQDYVPGLLRAGYEHRGERGVPGREYFRRGQPRAYHVHLVEKDGFLWQEYLAFRDYLRADHAAALEYMHLKRELAARFPRDREAYMNAKTAFVTEILQHAMLSDRGHR